MLTEWHAKYHTKFLKDLKKLDGSLLKIFKAKRAKILENPLRFKHLSGGENCYREEITSNIRIIYYVEGASVWFLLLERHDAAYEDFRKRLHDLTNK
ncbi:MAG: hypothetical protein ABIA93_07970 [Candidatus Woesearchaeota archaeon]